MQTIDTTAQASAATITEKELWALFVEHTMKRTFSMGPTVEQYKPDDYLRDGGIWDCLENFPDYLADGVAEAFEPEIELSNRIEEIECYLVLLKTVKEDFQSLKKALISDDEGTEGEELFHRPVIVSADAA